jgi:hypothetical protein
LLNTVLGSFSSGVAASTSSYESIASATGTGSSDTITFSSIPSGYKSLQVRALFRSSSAFSTPDTLRVTLNGSTTTYASHNLYGDGSTVTANGTTGSAYIRVLSMVTGSTSGGYSVLILDLIDNDSTTKNKTVRIFGGCDTNGLGAIGLHSGLWATTSAVTSMTFAITGAGNLDTTSTFALYGIKG